MGSSHTPWVGSAYRHIPAAPNHDVLDFRAEWGRHLGNAFLPDVSTRVAMRTVYRLHVRLDAVVDLRAAGSALALGSAAAPEWLMDKERTRSAAQQVRDETTAQAILVPSVAFLDDLARWNLVVFLDKLPADPHAWIQRVETVGPLRWGD